MQLKNTLPFSILLKDNLPHTNLFAIDVVCNNKRQGATQGKEQATTKAKRGANVNQKNNKQNTMQKKKIKKKINKAENLLGFVSLSFFGLPWWRCCYKP